MPSQSIGSRMWASLGAKQCQMLMPVTPQTRCSAQGVAVITYIRGSKIPPLLSVWRITACLMSVFSMHRLSVCPGDEPLPSFSCRCVREVMFLHVHVCTDTTRRVGLWVLLVNRRHFQLFIYHCSIKPHSCYFCSPPSLTSCLSSTICYNNDRVLPRQRPYNHQISHAPSFTEYPR